VRPVPPTRPIFDRAAAQHADRLAFGRCDVDQNPATAARLNIMSIPTLVLFDGAGREVNRLVGAPGSRQLEDFLSAATPGAA
jgi:thioredoxin-like negative regulator of GroEL